MSFFDDASLVFLPSGQAGKDGKAYSMKPTNGDGDFTFSRGSNLTATRVDSNGLIEKGRENLLLQSNQFDTTWANSGTNETSGQSGYDGSSDAWLLTKNVSDGYIYQNISQSGVQCVSVYAKANAIGGIQIYVNAGTTREQSFNLTNGTLIGSGNNIDAKIESVGNGWYRCSMALSDAITRVRFYPMTSAGDKSGTSGSIYIQDAQLEQGLVATEYIESGATTGLAGILEDSPRFDYSGGASCPSLLLEPSRTNLIGYSEYMAQSELSSYGTDVTHNATQSPSGKNSAALVYEESSNSQHYVLKGVTTSSSTTYTQSAFVKKKDSGIYASLRTNGVGGNSYIIFDFDTATIVDEGSDIISSGVVDYSNGWYRIHMTYTLATISFIAGITNSTTNPIPSYLGTGKGYYLWGAQVEQGSYPTSYIPNHSGGSVTREADSSNITSGLSIGNGSEFGLYYEIDVDAIPRNSSSPFIQIQFTTANGGVGIKGASDAIANYIDLYGTTDFSKYFSARSMGNGIIKFFINYSSGTGDFYLNGTKYTGAISGSTSGCEIDSVYLLGSAYKLKAKQILIFPTALSDAECITLTS